MDCKKKCEECRCKEATSRDLLKACRAFVGAQLVRRASPLPEEHLSPMRLLDRLDAALQDEDSPDKNPQ